MTTTLILAYYDKQRGYRDLGQFLQKMQAPPIEKKIGRNNDIYIN